MKLDVLKAVVDRFSRFVNKDGPQMPGHEAIGNCWTWKGATTKSKANKDGVSSQYGTFSIDLPRDQNEPTTRRRIHVKAHRFSLAIFGNDKQGGDGVIPDGMDCCHRCDNTLCVRPSHLFWATHVANMADYAAKHGRICVAKLKEPRRRELLDLEPAGEFAGVS